MAVSSVDLHVGERLRRARKAAGLSQIKLAAMLEITSTTLAQFEAGHRRISAIQLFEISQILDVAIEHFFEGLTSDRENKKLTAGGSAHIVKMSERQARSRARSE